MTTILQACKQVVADSIDQDYLHEYGSLSDVYNSEYGKHNGLSTKACRDYLQGLPSVCTVPFYNGEILELLAKYGITRKSESAQAKLIDDYWLNCGHAFYMMVRR